MDSISSENTSGQRASKPLPTVNARLSEFTDDPIACMRRLQAEAGNLVALEQDDQQIVFAFGAELNRQVLSQADRFHSQFFAIRGPRNSAQRRLTSGLLSMNGKEHADQRRVVRAAFEKRVIPGYTRMVQHHAKEMLSDWRPGQIRDISREMTDLMLKITSSMLFGLTESQLAFEIGRKMDEWVQLNHELGMGALISNEHFYPRYQYLLSFAEELEGDVREMIRRRSNQDASSAMSGNDVISLLLKAQDAGQPITESQLVGQVALLFAAAHMTTAHTLGWTLFLLAQHPEVMQELNEWIARGHGEKPQAGRPDSTVGVSGNASLDVLDRVIRESMRILPASAYSQRVTNGVAELNGTWLRSGTVVIFSQFMTHRSLHVFAESDQFKPARWIDSRPSSYEYLPFGGGSRLCLGAPLALSILRTVIPMILSQCGLQIVAEAEISARVVSTMLSPSTSLPMHVLPRGSVSGPTAVAGNIASLVTMPGLQTDRVAA